MKKLTYSLLVLFTLSQSIYAQDRSYNVYVDTDYNASTGCTVSQPIFNTQFNGIDGYISIVTSDSPVSITTSLYHKCVGGSFDSGSAVVDSALGFNTSINNDDVFEMQLPFTELDVSSSTTMRIFYSVESSLTTDILTQDNGNPILVGIHIPTNIPFLSVFSLLILTVLFILIAKSAHSKKFSAVALVLAYSSLVWAMTYIIDGETNDWANQNAVLDGIGDNSSPGNYSDITRAYATLDDQFLTTRIDIVDVENDSPTANGLSENLSEDDSMTITLTGNDTDGNPLTFLIVNGPINGQLSAITQINSTSASVVYTPNADYFGNDSFTYVSNDGQVNSTDATVSLVVAPVNDQPSFDATTDINITKDSGQYVAPWATNISPGATNESSQVLSFSVLSNDNTTLIPVNPTISSTGQISFNPAMGENGTANFTVQLQDDGGTSNGGNDTSTIFNLAINVEGINDAPSFVAGPDQTVNEDAGIQVINAWATALSPGPADESGQTLTFNITNNTNPALFSTLPSVDGTTGDLSFTTALNANGIATITLNIQDNGGTANGGVDTSATQSFNIIVNPVNDAPTFSNVGDVAVLKDSGPYSAIWANSLSAGPVDETGQLLSFNIINVTNSGLFSTLPNVDSTGNLTFTMMPDVSGVASVSINLMDNGGVSNGGVDTSNTVNFDILIGGVNDAPSFVVGADENIFEDAGAQTVVGWATALSPGPADESGQSLTFNITNNTNPALFSVPPSVDGVSGDLTYTTAPNINGMAEITLNVQDNGGTADGGIDTSPTQTFNIIVNSVNDAPIFNSSGDVAVLKDSGPYSNSWAINLSAGPSDEAGQTMNFNVINVTNSSLFSTQPDIDSTGNLTFELTTNISGTATVTVNLMDDGGTANGGSDTSANVDFDIVVGGVNDAPSFVVGADENIFEDAGAQTVVGWATALSPGPADESGQTLTFNITNNTNPTLFSVAPSVDGVTGNLTYTTATDINGSATITLNVMDNGGVADGGVDTSPEQSFNIIVGAVNDAPSFNSGGDVTVLEESSAYSAAWATGLSEGPTDENGQSLSFNITGNSNGGLFSSAPTVNSSGELSFTPAANASGTATISINIMDDGGNANGGIDTSTDIMFDINITDINDEPSFTVGADETVLEDSGAQTVMGWATGISAGTPSESGQALSFDVTNDNNSLFSVQPAVSSTGDLTYTPASDANGTATVTLNLMDDGGTANGGDDTSPNQMFTITVTAVNDAPSYTSGGNVAVLEDSGVYNMSWATGFLAGAVDESGQTFSFNVTGNSDPMLFASGPTISNTGQLTFTPAADAVGVATITANIMDNGGTANGGVDTSAGQMFTITLNQVNDEPSFTKGADQSVNQNSGAQTVNSWVVAASAGPLNESGQALSYNLSNNNNALFSAQPSVNSMGDLSYTSANNMSGTAVVTINVMDNGGTANSGDDTSPNQTFNITILNPPPTISSPPSYNVTTNVQIDIPAMTGLLNGASGGTGALTVGNAMNPAPTVTANGGNLSINSATGLFSYNPPPGLDTGMDTFTYKICDSAMPTSVCSADITTTFSLSGNTIWFIDASASAGDGRLTTPFNSISAFMAKQGGGMTDDPAIGDCIFLDEGNYTGPLTLLNNQKVIGKASATTVSTECSVTPVANSTALPSVGATRPVLTSAGVGVGLASGNTLRGFNVGNSTNKIFGNIFGTLTINNMALTGTGKAVDLTTGTAAATFDSINSTNSSSEGIDLSSVAGSFTVTGTTNISSSTLSGIQVASSSGTFTFNTVTINGSGGAGLQLPSNTGTINVNSGSVGAMTSNTGDAVFISGGNGNITINASLSNITTNSVVEITGRTGGTIVIGGAINHTTNVNGIYMYNNTAGSTSFSGSSKILNTGTNFAFTSTTNAGHTINITNGGLDIDTTSGIGFNATGGGTINVTGLLNTITTSTGIGINIANTTIGASNVTFQSVSVNGAANGIVLNNTGVSGGLKITGTGTSDNTGGSIQNTTSDSVLLIDTNNVGLSNMLINNSGADGVSSLRGSNHVISGTDIKSPGRAGWEIVNLAGLNRFDTDSQIDNVNSVNFGFVEWMNTNVGTNGTPATLTINDSIFRDQAATNGNSVIDVVAAGNSVMTLNIENNSEFRSLFGNSVNAAAGLNIGDTAVLNTNISNSFFENSIANGIQTVFAGSVGGSTNNMNMDNNTHQNLAVGLALTAGIVHIQSFDSGVLTGTLSNKNMDNIGRRGIQIAPENTTGTNSSIVFNSHDIDNTAQEALLVSSRVNTNLDVTINNNLLGQVSDVATLGREGIELLSEDNSHLDMLVTGNTVDNFTNGSSDEVVDIDAENTSIFHITFTNNIMNANGSDPTGEFEAEVEGTATMCLDLDGNTVGSTGTATFELDDDGTGATFTVESLGSVAGDNTGTVNVNDVSINNHITNGGNCLEVGH